ncbi:MAG: ferredoxin-thioredoxin reductase catalytic domain-containing protein [Candidatus Aminicenantaceae bacterium]
MKKFWRCHVCNDIHFGVTPPEICPTCKVKNAFMEVSSEEARKIIAITKTKINKDKFQKAIKKFAENREFQVNPDKEKVNTLLEGVFECEKNHGFKYCPCRMIEKDVEKDLKLICPCNFLIHETYKDKDHGECWCGLFVKKRR